VSALLGLLVRFLLLFLVARLIVRSVSRAREARRPLERERGRRSATELVRDPICNTFLPRSSAVAAVIGGREELFCSRLCADRARQA
jgi:hypothetical protein